MIISFNFPLAGRFVITISKTAFSIINCHSHKLSPLHYQADTISDFPVYRWMEVERRRVIKLDKLEEAVSNIRRLKTGIGTARRNHDQSQKQRSTDNNPSDGILKSLFFRSTRNALRNNGISFHENIVKHSIKYLHLVFLY